VRVKAGGAAKNLFAWWSRKHKVGAAVFESQALTKHLLIFERNLRIDYEAMCKLYIDTRCMLSSGLFPGVCSLRANVSEHYVCSIFTGELV
jgi:hypothetical protein